jgi:hypothetical protein
MLYHNLFKYKVGNLNKIFLHKKRKEDGLADVFVLGVELNFFSFVSLKVLMEFSNSVSSHNWEESLDSERLILHLTWRLQTENSDSYSLNKCRESILG